MVSIGIVGVGYWGKNLLRNFDDVGTVTACCHTGDPENAAWVRENYSHVDLTTSYDALLGRDDVDAVAIATPIGTHAALTTRALRTGKDVFVEKPLAATVEDARAVADVASETGQTVFVGYIFVHHPLVRRLMERADGERVQACHFSWRKLGAFDSDVALDLVSHPVSLAHHLFEGPPREVDRAYGATVARSTDVVGVTLRYPGGRAFHVDVNRASPSSEKQLLVELGDATYVWSETELCRFDPDEETYETVATRAREPLRVECERFVDAVVAGRPVETGAAFGLAVNETLDRLD